MIFEQKIEKNLITKHSDLVTVRFRTVIDNNYHDDYHIGSEVF